MSQKKQLSKLKAFFKTDIEQETNTESRRRSPFHILQTLGNQSAGHLLQNKTIQAKTKQEGMVMKPGSADPEQILTKLNHGHPLDQRIKERVGGSYGEDFSDVRVHTGTTADNLANEHNARAFTIGTDIVMGKDEYKPGTAVGDALLAHELAHVAQQKNASSEERHGVGNSRALEADADRSAAGALSSLWVGTKSVVGNVMRNVGPAMRSGLSLQRCPTSNISFDDDRIPEYLGPESRETLETIKFRFENANLLQNTVVYGPLISIFSSGNAIDTAYGVGSHNYEAQARAVGAIPDILRNRVIQDVTLLLLSHENEMNEQERAYWHRVLERFNSPGGMTAEE